LVTPAAVAEMIALPAETAVTRPSATVATAALEEVQDSTATLAVSWCVSPTLRVIEDSVSSNGSVGVGWSQAVKPTNARTAKAVAKNLFVFIKIIN
jgi:hypothetical protein